MITRTVLLLISVFTISLGHAQQGTERIAGVYEDGTRWIAIKPDNWNGSLALDLDGAGLGNIEGMSAEQLLARSTGVGSMFYAWLLEQGYAVGGITREPVGYDFVNAADLLMGVRERFIETWDEPQRTLAVGVSRGAYFVRINMEVYPDIYDGGFMTSGGGLGELAGLNQKMSAKFLLKTLVNPDASLELVNINPQQENAALRELIAEAYSTPEGKARLAFAAAIVQFPAWSSPDLPKPEPGDYDAIMEQVALNFNRAVANVYRAGIERLIGANPSWNTDVDYADLLERSGQKTMVEALYTEAGLSLDDDLQTLTAAPRISASTGAVRRAEPLMTYSGRLQDPLLNLDNADPVDGASNKLAYIQTLEQAGKLHNYRLIWTDIAGHAQHTNIEKAVGFSLMIERLDTGQWPEMSVAALYQRGQEIAAATELELGEMNFFDPGQISPPLFTWDGFDWGSYQRGQ